MLDLKVNSRILQKEIINHCRLKNSCSCEFCNHKNSKINAIKIDTEGEDLNVLKGGINLIKYNMPKIIIETRRDNAEQIFKLLNEIGYDQIYDKNKMQITSNNPLNFGETEISQDIFCE